MAVHKGTATGTPISMAYDAVMRAIRACTAQCRDGAPCRAWASWDSDSPLCSVHSGRHHRGPLPPGGSDRRHSQVPPCRCDAYPAFPHRPGSGWCQGGGRPPVVTDAERRKLGLIPQAVPIGQRRKRAWPSSDAD